MRDVEVLYEDAWCPGEVRMVKWVDDVEVHQVQYRRPGELSSNIDDFPTRFAATPSTAGLAGGLRTARRPNDSASSE